MEYIEYKEIENILNQYNDWCVPIISDDGRMDSQQAEPNICRLINERLNVGKIKTHNRAAMDLHMLIGEDLKCVQPDNYTNTISFTKLTKMLNLEGGTQKSIRTSYKNKKNKGEIKLVNDYYIIYLNKQTNKFTICSITELPLECITVNPSNGIQTKIPTYLVSRTDDEKFELIHSLFIEYINKRILNHAKEWGDIIYGK